jgi:hypothetical protein
LELVFTSSWFRIMSDPDRNRQREHWQAIAEQLGLAPEDEPGAEQPRAEQPRPVTPAITKVESPPAEAASETVDEDVWESVPEPLAAPVPEVEQERAVASAEQPSAGDLEEEPHTAEPSELEDAERGERHRRRRRSKSGRPARSRSADLPEGDPGTAEEAPGEEHERSTRRGRGRRKPGKSTQRTTRPAVDEAAPPPSEESTETDDADAEDLGSLTNWNVPSWNELIASLYRPDR